MTTDQPSLFPDTAPYVAGSATSYEAAKAIEPRAETLRRLVLDWFRQQGKAGGTDAECQEALDLHAHTQCPRRIELCRAGLLFDSKQHRRTKTGRKATVWVATESRP